MDLNKRLKERQLKEDSPEESEKELIKKLSQIQPCKLYTPARIKGRAIDYRAFLGRARIFFWCFDFSSFLNRF